VENVLSQKDCEEISETLIDLAGHNVAVDVQRSYRNKGAGKSKKIRKGNGKKTDILECTLLQATQLMMESSHNTSYFCFAEGLLNKAISSARDNNDMLQLEKISKILYDSKEKLFHNSVTAQRHSDGDKNDIFGYFPEHVRPMDCVILAGEGATSTLHRDPFTWTGTSLCLEGTKLWRFIPPPGVFDATLTDVHGSSGVNTIDEALNSYRLPSVAWGDVTDGSKPIQLSAGWQTNLSLFEKRDDDKVPSAYEFAMMEEELSLDIKLTNMESIAKDLTALTPSFLIKNTNNNNKKDNNNDISTIWTVIQKPGDLLVIPAFWWHQTYALEPSLAIASQRCGLERDFQRVVQHMIENAGHHDSDKHKTDEYNIVSDFVTSGKLGDNITAERFVDILFRYITSSSSLQ
jgi:hypothetical protein